MKLSKNLNNKQKALTILSLNALILLLIIYFIILPYIKSVKEANASLIENRVKFETLLIKEKKFSKISKNLSNIQSEIGSIDKAFINKNNKLEFITMMEGLADSNSLSLDMNIDFEAIEKSKSVPLKITVIGAYTNLTNFLVSLENMSYYINIYDININANPSSIKSQDGEPTLTMNLGANTYWK